MSTFTNATKHRVTENFWKHGNRVLPRCSFAPERTFLARKGSPSSFYPSTTVLQHLISQSFFNSSVLTKYTQRAFYNSFLKLEEDRAVKKKKKKDNSLSHQKTSVLCPSAPAPVSLSTGCLRSRNARLCHQREISDRKRLQGCRAGMGREQPSSSKVLQTSTKH